jgi:hypothetical protein
MKKITLLFLAMLATNLSFAQFLQDFNAPAFPPTGWVLYAGTNGLGTAEQWKNQNPGQAVPSTYAFSSFELVTPAASNAQDWLVSPLIPVNATQNVLTFAATDFNLAEYGSVLTVRVSTTSQTDISSFTTILSLTEAMLGNLATPSFKPFNVSLATYAGQSVYIAFVHEQNDGDNIALDNVRVIPPTTGVPLAATTPTPTDMAVNVPIDTANNDSVTLAWVLPAGNAATDYQLFFGTSATAPPLLGVTPNTGVSITGLIPSTTYYWRAIPGNSAGRAANPVTWSFTTAGTASVNDETVNFFTLSPNPTNDFLTITTESPVNEITVYNTLGQVIMTNPRNNNNRLDVSDLQSGIYLITVSSDDKRQTSRFIKN